MSDVQIDMDKVMAQTVSDLGAQLGMLSLELNAQRALNAKLQERIAELESDEEAKPTRPKAA